MTKESRHRRRLVKDTTHPQAAALKDVTRSKTKPRKQSKDAHGLERRSKKLDRQMNRAEQARYRKQSYKKLTQKDILPHFTSLKRTPRSCRPTLNLATTQNFKRRKANREITTKTLVRRKTQKNVLRPKYVPCPNRTRNSKSYGRKSH